MSKKYILKARLDEVVIELESELKISNKDVKKITLREPTVRDIKLVNHIEDELENNTTLVANLTGYTVEEIELLPIHIFEVLVEGLGTFQSSQEEKS